MPTPITVQATVNAPMEKVWKSWNEPQHINNWAFAQDDWEASAKENDLKIGGKFKTVMSAKDKSASFAFEGTYTAVQEYALIEYDMSDGRHVKVEFVTTPKGVHVAETFDPESDNPPEMQKSGWQAILENFRKYVEEKK